MSQELVFSIYQEKPVVPKVIKAHRFKRSEASGLCFDARPSWAKWMRDSKVKMVYSEDVTPEEFEKERKLAGLKKSELIPYVNVNGKRKIVRHNEWIVIFEDGSIRVVENTDFKEKYIVKK